jgi:hypothetical protein
MQNLILSRAACIYMTDTQIKKLQNDDQDFDDEYPASRCYTWISFILDKDFHIISGECYRVFHIQEVIGNLMEKEEFFQMA